MRDLMCDQSIGRLTQRRFLFLNVVLTAFLCVYLFAFAALLAIIIHFGGIGEGEFRLFLQSKPLWPVHALLFIGLLVFLAAFLNILAKRWRDTGISGWSAALATTLGVIATLVVFGPLLAAFCLLCAMVTAGLIPTFYFSRTRPRL